MNSNWRNRPTSIDFIPKDIDYVISIDENGTSNLKKVCQSKKTGQPIPKSERHFVVTACLMRTCDIDSSAEMVMTLKRKYWDDALFLYAGEKKRVCFHSREIRSGSGAFHPSIIDYGSFICDLTELIEHLPITIYAAHINKVNHVRQYDNPASPYELCMNFLLERIMMNIGVNKRCVVVLESRGKNEDRELLKQIKFLLDHGNQYNSAESFSKICGVYFNPKWSQEAQCQKSYWALEMADVCSYPIYKHFAHGQSDKAFEVVSAKFKNYPYYWGFGLKTFPYR